MKSLRNLTAAALLASFIAVPMASVAAAAPAAEGDRYQDRSRGDCDYRDCRDDRHRHDRVYRDDRIYRDDRVYRDRRLGPYDRVWRGSDDRYYCRRDDGTTGAVVGAVTGGALGGVIAPRGSKPLGAIIGAIAGSAIGKAASSGNVYCR
jgi:hypothetical protein